MSKPRGSIFRGDRPQCIPQSGHQVVLRAGLRRPQGFLTLALSLLNRVEFGEIGRQELQERIARFNGGPRRGTLVGQENFGQHDITTPHHWRERLHAGSKGQHTYPACKYPSRLDAGQAKRSYHCLVISRLAGSVFHHPLVPGRPSELARQSRMGTGFINEFQVFDKLAQLFRNLPGERSSQWAYLRRLPLAVVSRHRFRHLPTVELLGPKVLAISAGDCLPALTAAITRSINSREYGFMTISPTDS